MLMIAICMLKLKKVFDTLVTLIKNITEKIKKVLSNLEYAN